MSVMIEMDSLLAETEIKIKQANVIISDMVEDLPHSEEDKYEIAYMISRLDEIRLKQWLCCDLLREALDLIRKCDEVNQRKKATPENCNSTGANG